MGYLLSDLLLDLRRRTDAILQELSTLPLSICPTYNVHKDNVSSRLQRAGVAIQRMLDDPDLLDPILEPNQFMDFKRLSELISNIEESSLLLLKRYSTEDLFLSSLVRQICREVGYQDDPPLCGGLSFQYFQALVPMDIILTPQRQGEELLSLPDLYHELAHFVISRNRIVFDIAIHKVIETYFNEALRKASQQGVPEASIQKMKESRLLWLERWRGEFVCDLIATYWCGPAYGWANLLLSATRGEPFEDMDTHPSDDSRNMGIECMLTLIGEESSVASISSGWEDLKRLSPSEPGAGYAKRYPTRLIEKLAQSVHDACVAHGFRSFSRQTGNGTGSVSEILTEAWALFRKDAGTFDSFKSSALQRIKARIDNQGN